jgi:hypothetical protein
MKYLFVLLLSILIFFFTVTNKPIKQKKLSVYHPKIINAVIQVESSGNPKAISKKGCIGLMQINYKVWGKYLKNLGIINAKKDLFIPEKNIASGKAILAYYSYKVNHDITQTLYLYSGKNKDYINLMRKELHEDKILISAD